MGNISSWLKFMNKTFSEWWSSTEGGAKHGIVSFRVDDSLLWGALLSCSEYQVKPSFHLCSNYQDMCCGLVQISIDSFDNMCPPVLCRDVCGGEGWEHDISGRTNTKQASPGSIIHTWSCWGSFFSCEKFTKSWCDQQESWVQFRLNSKKLATT